MDSAILTLRVGEIDFRTTKSILVEGSEFFASMLSGNWAETQSQSSDTLFIDTDPELFKHILRFLRTGIFPIFWTRDEGFDFVLYAAVLLQAQFFGVKTLADWISGKKYLWAIKTSYSFEEVEGVRGIADWAYYKGNASSNAQRTFYPQWRTKQEYRCPRNISIHHGDPYRCGRACDNAKVSGVSNYEDVQVLTTLVCETVVHFRNEVCHVDSVPAADPGCGDRAAEW